MSKIAIMLQFNGNWDNYGRFRDFEVDAIVVDENASYSILISTIAEQLSIDTSEKIIKNKYMVNDNCPPMEIRNDMGVRVYMETKKDNKNLGSYPLCISVRDFNMELAIANDNTSAATGLYALVKTRKRTAVVVGSMVIPKYCDPKTVYTPKDIQTDMLSEYGKTADECFLYAFVTLCTSISGWQHYRPVVVVDGTFLKSAYRGIMLTTSTMDAAGTIFPLAYVVVDSEKDASWKWFFEQFKQAYGERPSMCVVSDKNESILKATSIVYSGMPHYSCIWHIWTNIRSKFKKGHLQLHELYFVAARSYTLDEFNERMSKIEEVDPRVKSYLYDIGYHRWSRVHATVNRTWTMASNIAESLNAVTKDARELPIFDLLEYMRTLLERWTNEKLLKMKGTFTFLGSKFNKELENNRTLSQKLRVRASTDHIHTMLDGVKRYIVCLKNKKCSCGQFQLEELPCVHALAALRHRNETYENYCSPYYTRESLLRTYEIPVNHLHDESKWNVPQHILDEVVNLPMGDKRQPGRPQKEKYKTYDEIKLKKYKVSCENCGGEGHNKRCCKNMPKKK
uniref:Uncharacterized protein LOC104239928 n=1 Tax=Nicotiana sylvestris TaxID=4096 RepID=A0A1U7XQ66_NICSY|nr:PREDICTED: uncharacterized protein LOC104239928 [Nicotiana sylvestris]